MKVFSKRGVVAVAFALTILLADIGMGLDFDPVPGVLDRGGEEVDRVMDSGSDEVDRVVDTVERVWEGGGSHLAFVDTMSQQLAQYLEEMEPLPDGTGFDYYGGAIPQVDADEVFGRWGPDRWRHEWWRWGEESFQQLAGGTEPGNFWHQDDSVPGGVLRFSMLDDPLNYPQQAFSAAVSPVVDLRDVEPLVEDTDEEARYRLKSQPALLLSGTDSVPDEARGEIANQSRQTGVAEIGEETVSLKVPAVQNASAALRLNHLYDFVTDGEQLRDGARVEVARFEPRFGWQEWEGLVPSANVLRVGEEEVSGRYSTTDPGSQIGIGGDRSTRVHADFGEDDDLRAGASLMGVTVHGNETGDANVTQDPPGYPWLYQGEIRASSSRDHRGSWSGFGGSSQGFVESIFDLTEYAGHLVRFRFVTASQASGDGSQPNPGLGWLLEQLEVHALAEGDVKTIGPVTPVEGALLGPDHGEAHPVVALQNPNPVEERVVVEIGIEDGGATVQEIVVPPGPWGRVFVTAPESLQSLGGMTPGLHHLRVEVSRIMELDEIGFEEVDPVSSDTSRYHFLRVGPDWLPEVFGPEWPGELVQAVRMETEGRPLDEDDEFHDPEERLIQREQEMLIHMDLMNLGPEEIDLDVATNDLLSVEYRDARGDPQGSVELMTDSVVLPVSRDASGLLGGSDSVKRLTWRWSGIDFADVLEVLILDGAGSTVLHGGNVRVEAMEPSALDVHFSNLWGFTDKCRRGEVATRMSLVCGEGASIASPAGSVLVSDLRRGQEAVLAITHRGGGGEVTFDVADNILPLAGERFPPLGLEWEPVGTVTLDESSDDWQTSEKVIHKFGSDAAWFRLNISGQGPGDFVVNEVRVEVGPEGRRLPLLWENFLGNLVPETSGTIRASGDQVAVLHGSSARATEYLREDLEQLDEDYDETRDDFRGTFCPAWDAIIEEVPFAGTPCNIMIPPEATICIDGVCSSDQFENPGFAGIEGTVTIDTIAPGVSMLHLPEVYELDGARPTLQFDHWIGPSVSAAGHVEVAHLDSNTLRSLEEGRSVNVTWETAATFPAPRLVVDADMVSEEVALWGYAGESILIRFRYQYDPVLQPGIAPQGWVMDSIALAQTSVEGREPVHMFSGNFQDDGYFGFRVDFPGVFEGLTRAAPEILTQDIVDERCCTETGGQVPNSQRVPGEWLPQNLFDNVPRPTSMFFSRGDPVVQICADRNTRDTYQVGQSIITDPVDLRGFDAPILELEHGGQFNRAIAGIEPARKVMDLEWQVLGSDGRWGQWQRATPHDVSQIVDGSFQRLEGGLSVPGDRDQLIEDPFTQVGWNDFLVVNETGVPQRFDLSGHGPAGDIARFRFIVWEEWDASFGGSRTMNERCHEANQISSARFRWHVYSMRIFEDSHIFDAGVTGIAVNPNDRDLVDQFAPGLRGDRDHPTDRGLAEAVVSGDGQGWIGVEVEVTNMGRLDHVANVSLDLIDSQGARVDVPIHFVDRTDPDLPTEVENQNHGFLSLAGGGIEGHGEVREAQFIMEIGGRGAVEPGEYRLRAVVDLDDAPDSNPRNDLLERSLWVAPVRALDLNPSTLHVEPSVGLPEERRLLHIDLRNRGNVEEGNVTVKARVVQLVGFGTEADIGPSEHPYELEPQTRTGMAPGSFRGLTWDLVEDRVDDSLPPLEDLLVPGKRYAVSVTIHPSDDSVRDWWTGERHPVLTDPDGPLRDMIDSPGERCACYHAAFLAEDLIAGSDFTPDGTESVLNGYLTEEGESVEERWQALTRFRHDGELVEAEGRSDLPTWELVDANVADEELGQSGVQGAAWHLPAYEGYEVLRHELISPPLPSHVIDEQSRGILDLRYASGLSEGQAKLEVRSLLPGGKWGEWVPSDELRMQRVAVVLPPDFPRVVSDALSESLRDIGRYPNLNNPDHPVPPYYQITPEEDEEIRGIIGGPYPWETPIPPLQRENFFSFGGDWSPFPLFRENPEEDNNIEVVRALAMVLQRLTETLGEDNVRVFTTFPESQSESCFENEFMDGSPGWWDSDSWRECFGEFGVPPHQFDMLGISFETTDNPIFRVQGSEDHVSHQIPVLDIEELGVRIDTFGGIVLMGDGLSRWAASNSGRSDLLERLTPNRDFSEFNRVKTPIGDHGTPELERHFQELLPALRLSPAEGITVFGATGPASANLGASGGAEGVPLSLWVAPNSEWGDRPPTVTRCVVEMEGPNHYLLNMEDQPKFPCRRSVGESGWVSRLGTNYGYVAAPDAQAWVLRGLLEAGGAMVEQTRVLAGIVTPEGASMPFLCDAAPNRQNESWRGSLAPDRFRYNCIVPTPLVSTESDGLRFVTSPFAGTENANTWAWTEYWDRESVPFTGQEDAITWIDEFLAHMHGDSSLPGGRGDWENLPIAKGAPVGGWFSREGGRDQFIGETMQFRITVESDPHDPVNPGHGDFFLDSFQLFGTPRTHPKLDVRVADPIDGSTRAPNEAEFYPVIEVINRGINQAIQPTTIEVQMAQIPGRGDCGAGCEIPALHPVGDGPVIRELQIPGVGGGKRHVITVGGPEGTADPSAPNDISFSNQGTPITQGGRFPRIPNQDIWNDAIHRMVFNISASLTTGTQPNPESFDQIEVSGVRMIEDLVKETGRDIRISPNQAITGTASGGPIPGTDELQVDIRLSNTGSFRAQNGRVNIDVYWALPNDCFMRAFAFVRCTSEGEPLGQNRPGDQKWSVYSDGWDVRISRDTPAVNEMTSINLIERGLEPGVYQVDVTVRTLAPPGVSFGDIETRETRWIYLGDADGESDVPWAVYDGDLRGLSDEGIQQSFPQDADSDATSHLFVGPNDVCREDPSTTDSAQANMGDSLRHGWAVGGEEYNGPCEELLVEDPGFIQWTRDFEMSAIQEGTTSWLSGFSDTSPNDVGLGDFGPDRLVWYPGHEISPQGEINMEQPHGVAPTLANFAPGEAALVVDSRFTGSVYTGYVVEMQVPQRFCYPFSDSPGAPRGCEWRWNWGEGEEHWFPLAAVVEGTNMLSPADLDDQDISQPLCRASQGQNDPPGTRQCFRNTPTNPLGGLPGLWGRDSTEFPGSDNDGWVTLRYPIDPDPDRQEGLDDYCSNFAAVDSEDSGRSQDFPRPFWHCMYTAAHGNRDVNHEIPRPVAFRLSAASFGGDTGQSFWHVRNLSLTAHNLEIEGPDRFDVQMNDGESRLVPIEISNPSSVDDVVEIDVAMRRPQPGMDIGAARHSTALEFQQTITERLPAGSVSTIWVNASTDFGVFPQPGTYGPLEATISVRSLIAPLIEIDSALDITIRQLNRADLAIDEMVVNNRVDHEISASIGTPLVVSLHVQNEGREEAEDPVLVRLWAQEKDPVTGLPICPEGEETCRQLLGEEVVTTGFEPDCFQSRCREIINFEWTPQEMGRFKLQAEVNLPRPGDVIRQVPEAVFSNNLETRMVNVGPVPLAELHITDARLVRFDPETGCDGPENHTSRLIDGHTYCVQAHVANTGNSVAMFPHIEFSIGSREPWSFGQDWSPECIDPPTPHCLGSLEDEWVASSPVRAVRPVDGLMEFRVEVDTDSAVQSLAGMEKRLRTPVDNYDLELRSRELPELLLPKDGDAIITLDVRNTGTAVTTPIIRLDQEEKDLRFRLMQPPPLQPGETTQLSVITRSSFSAAEGTRKIDLEISTLEDPLVTVDVPLTLTILDDALANATALPMQTRPKEAVLEVMADNTGWAANSTWMPVEATGILSLAGPREAFYVEPHGLRMQNLSVDVPLHTPPGVYNGSVRFEVQHGNLLGLVDAPYLITVLPDPGLRASLEQDHVVSVRGLDANVTIRLENRGNQPVEAVLVSEVDNGALASNESVVLVQPGRSETVSFVVRPAEATRVLGETSLQWRVDNQDNWSRMADLLLWTVRNVPSVVRLDSTNLDEIEPRMGRMETARASLLNPTSDTVNAEVLLAVNGEIHSHKEATLEAGELSVVNLDFRIDQAGENVLQIIARPAGSQIGPQDPVFHEVGGIQARELSARTGDGEGFAPGPGIIIVLLMVIIAFALGRTRRPGKQANQEVKL